MQKTEYFTSRRIDGQHTVIRRVTEKATQVMCEEIALTRSHQEAQTIAEAMQAVHDLNEEYEEA